MKLNVIFANKIEDFTIGILPKIFPAIRIAKPREKLLRESNVTNRRVEPDIKALALSVRRGRFFQSKALLTTIRIRAVLKLRRLK